MPRTKRPLRLLALRQSAAKLSNARVVSIMQHERFTEPLPHPWRNAATIACLSESTPRRLL